MEEFTKAFTKIGNSIDLAVILATVGFLMILISINYMIYQVFLFSWALGLVVWGFEMVIFASIVDQIKS